MANPLNISDSTFEIGKAMIGMMRNSNRIVVLAVIIRLAQMAFDGFAVPGFDSWLPVIVALVVAAILHVIGYFVIGTVAKENGDV